MLEKAKKAVLYARYSSENQKEGKSIEYQIEHISAYAKCMGYIIYEEYVDEAKTGLNADRPMFKKLMDDASGNPCWDTILVYNFSRFFRDDIMSKMSKGYLRDLGFKVISVTETLDDGAVASSIEPFLDMMNYQQSTTLGTHTHSAMKLKAKEAKHCGGKPPLGYDVDKETQKLVINESEAECVRRIYQLFLANYSYSQMAEMLNNEGYRTKFGRPFTKHSFDLILQQRKYIGEFVWNKAVAAKHAKYDWKDGIMSVESKRFRKRWDFKPHSEWVTKPGGVPPIIDREEFDAVQEKLSERKYANAKGKQQLPLNRRSYFLGGNHFLICGNCGSYMTGNIHSGKKGTTISYSCPNHRDHKRCSTRSFTAKHLDFFVASSVVYYLVNESNLPLINQYIREEKPTKKHDKLKREITGLQTKINNLSDKIAEGYDELTDKLREVIQQKKQLEEKLASMKKVPTKIAKDDIKKVRKELRKYILHNDTPEVRELLKSVIEQITIDDETVTIKMHVA